MVEVLRPLEPIYELSYAREYAGVHARVRFCERDRGQRDNHLDRQGRRRVVAADPSRRIARVLEHVGFQGSV